MNAQQLTAAYNEYVNAVNAANAAINLKNLLSAPAMPEYTPIVAAGKLIADQGLVGALTRLVGAGLQGEYDGTDGDFWRLVAAYVIGAATE